MSATSMMPFRFSERRAFRIAEPRQQARLTSWMLGISLLFLALVIGNSYAAYGSLIGSALATVPTILVPDILLQTQHYIVVSAVLAGSYAIAMVAASIAFVHRLTGPVVAFERHVDSLKRGDYSARVFLRDNDGSHARLARQLNDLAAALEHQQKSQVDAT